MFKGIDPAIGTLLQKFVEKPETLSHLLFVGPPGSGKTTTANAIVQAFYGEKKHYTGKALFLNSSDERSLEAVRSKVYPFARSQIHNIFGDNFFSKIAPKIIIFDEAETLTEQAQSALRPLLDSPPKDLLIIFLCNSISRIHSSILYRFLRICFETANTEQFRNRFAPIYRLTMNATNDKKIATSDIHYRRGDIRFFLLQNNKVRENNNLGWNFLHLPPEQLSDYVDKLAQTSYIAEIIAQALFVFQKIGCIQAKDLETMFLFADADIINVRTYKETRDDFIHWVLNLRSKFENSLA
jgi:adenylate kinase family enzyme